MTPTWGDFMSDLQLFVFLVNWDLGLRPRLVYYTPLALRPRMGRRWAPVWERGLEATCSGVPVATT
jgi:hypothetical protein